jgi:hypothetical protein
MSEFDGIATGLVRSIVPSGTARIAGSAARSSTTRRTRSWKSSRC